MKITMLGWELPPHNSGGLGVACYHMARALAGQGADIDFVLPYQADYRDISFMRVHAAITTRPGEAIHMAYDNYSDRIEHLQDAYTTFASRLVKKTKPDVIHAHDWLTMKAGVTIKKATNTPLVVHVHATEFDRSGEHWGNPLVHEVEQHGLLMADRIIAVSAITKQVIIDNYDIPNDKIEVIHNSFDYQALSEHSLGASSYSYLKHMQHEGYTIVVNMTRFTVQKGLTHFLRAAAKAAGQHHKLLFVLAGDGEQRNELLALSAQLGIAERVFFTGFLRGQAWRDIYRLADVFVLSSVSEPFGLTALEAAAHNTAVVLTKQSGVGEVLHSVLRYDYWDTDRLADQLVGLACAPALSQTLRTNAEREYQRMSWRDVAAQCLALYHGVGAKA